MARRVSIRWIRKQIEAVREVVDAEIRMNVERGGMYAHGLSNEGFAGGYLEALNSTELLLSGVRPNGRFWDRMQEECADD